MKKNISKVVFIILLLGLCGLISYPVHAQSYDLSDILNGNVSGTYEKIVVTNVANTATLELDNITIEVDVSSGTPTVTSITLESGTFTYAGVEASITDASYDPSSKEFTATTNLAFPESLTISAQFSISQSGVEILGGRINLPDFEVGNVGVKNGYVEYFPQEDKLGGGADMTVPGLGGDPDNPATISGQIEIQNGALTMFAISADGLQIPLGDTDAFLNSIGVEGDNINDISQFSLTGSMGIVGGPEIGDTYTFEVDTTGTIWPANGWIDITGTSKLYGITTGEASFSYRPPYNITIGAQANFVDVFIASFTAGIDSSGVSGSAEGKLEIPSSVPIVGGYTLADAKASLHNSDFSGSVSITITPEIPEACIPAACTNVPYAYPCPSWSHPFRWCSGSKQVCTPKVCTPAIPAVKASAGFKFTSGKFSFSTKQARQNAWEIPFNEAVYSNERNLSMQFMTNWSRLDKVGQSGNLRPFSVTPAGEPVTGFDITTDVPAAIFRITFANTDVTMVDATLTLPDGTVLPITDGALPNGFAAALGFSRFNPDAKEAYFFLYQPVLGSYTVTLNDADTLGEYSVELLAQNQEPSVVITNLQQTDTAGVYQLDWIDEDPDDNATVRFYLDTDRKNEDGFLLGFVEEDDETNSILLDTNAADVQPGYYYVFVTVDDGKNSPAVAYSGQHIWVDNGKHPQSVTQIAIASGDEQFTVQWDYNNNENTKYFTILYTANEYLSIHDNHVTVDKDVRSFTVKGLKNGTPLLVSVLAVDERGYSSAPVTILRVVPSPGFGYTPPVISSKPDPDATVGNLYFYLPKFYDADILTGEYPNSNTDSTIEADQPLYTWKLLEAPEGMMIDEESGLLTWTPAEDQIGDYNVVILLTEYVHLDTSDPNNVYTIEENVDTQDYTLTVLPPDNTNGVETNPYDFMTSPPLFAHEGSVYEYDISMLAPEGAQIDYSLEEGPEGMTIDDNGQILWDVPANANGSYVNIGALINGEFFKEQTYYLHVVNAKNTLTPSSGIRNFPWQSLQ